MARRDGPPSVLRDRPLASLLLVSLCVAWRPGGGGGNRSGRRRAACANGCAVAAGLGGAAPASPRRPTSSPWQGAPRREPLAPPPRARPCRVHSPHVCFPHACVAPVERAGAPIALLMLWHAGQPVTIGPRVCWSCVFSFPLLLRVPRGAAPGGGRLPASAGRPRPVACARTAAACCGGRAAPAATRYRRGGAAVAGRVARALTWPTDGGPVHSFRDLVCVTLPLLRCIFLPTFMCVCSYVIGGACVFLLFFFFSVWWWWRPATRAAARGFFFGGGGGGGGVSQPLMGPCRPRSGWRRRRRGCWCDARPPQAGATRFCCLAWPRRPPRPARGCT